MDLERININLDGFGKNEVESVRKIRRTPAGCALDIGDGSERSEYVNQDYIINHLRKLHRNVGLMYTYYPKDEQWPERISDACRDMVVHYQWDYPYDDYFPYGGGIGGSTENEPFNQMRDIRRHGQDVTLTLTIDCSLEDEYLIRIARDLRTFGRMRLRINHECSGRWFTHNRRFSYEEIGKFFVRFHKIIKQEAPNVSTIFCAGFIDGEGKVEYEDEFREAYNLADVWSADRYLSLHSKWPFSICEKGDKTYYAMPVREYIKTISGTVNRLYEITGRKVPFSASEFNSDGDVTGSVDQGKAILRFAEYVAEEKPVWFNSMSMYQFRDRGRLGLEMEDPNNPGEGIVQPLMKDYKKIMEMPYFRPGNEMISELPRDKETAETRWGSSEDAEGIEIDIRMKGEPVYFDIAFGKEDNLVFEINGKWFYKKPGVTIMDVMPAFFEEDSLPVHEDGIIRLRIFAPPCTGENPVTDRSDWALNYYSTIKLPRMRIRYEACGVVDTDLRTDPDIEKNVKER